MSECRWVFSHWYDRKFVSALHRVLLGILASLLNPEPTTMMMRRRESSFRGVPQPDSKSGLRFNDIYSLGDVVS